jgi:aspartate aminotransferase
MSTLAFTPSTNVADLHESATIAVSARAKALAASGRAIIDLGAGEPDFPTPRFICDAAHAAIDAGKTRYTQVEGILSLREAIAAWANTRRSGTRVSAGNVVVTSGSKQALFNACFTLFGQGDEVLVPTPAWTSYYEMIGLARAVAVPVRGSRARDLKATVADLRAAASSRTGGLFLNSPCNPTGAVYDRDELAAILELAAHEGWWVISDEIYRRIVYDGEAPSLLDVPGDAERLIVVDGVAKAYSMTGWRIGWAIAPQSVARAMTALQSHTTSNASTPAQHAALAALTRPEADGAVRAMVHEFRARRDAALTLLRDAGADVIEPRGAFYLFVRVADDSAGGDAGTACATRLLELHGVAVVPGAAFQAPNWVRLSYAAPAEHVVAGAHALVSVLER